MINVACNFDSRFELPFAVLAASIEKHSQSDVTLHAFHEGRLNYAQTLVGAFEKVKVLFHDVSGAFNKYETQSNITFARLHLHSLLDGVGRVIYLDSDMIVLRDLTELFNVDLHGKPIAAVLDYVVALWVQRKDMIGSSDFRCQADVYLRHALGMKNGKDYINTGLLVIDTAEYVTSGMPERVERFLKETPHRIFNDQDALNAVLDGNVSLLDPRWNCFHELNDYAKLRPTSTEIKNVLKSYANPWIIHFAGRKPWDSTACPGPFDRLFWDHVGNDLPQEWLFRKFLFQFIPPSAQNALVKVVSAKRKIPDRTANS